MIRARFPFTRQGPARQGQCLVQSLALALLIGVVAPFGGCAQSPAPAASSSSPTPAASPAASAETKPAAEKPAGLPDRDPALACRLVRQEGAVLLDVRTPEEFAEGHVDGAINIPHDQVDARATEIDELQGGDKAKPIVVYCRSGRRASIAKQSLMDGGRSQVTNLGGLTDWPECPPKESP